MIDTLSQVKNLPAFQGYTVLSTLTEQVGYLAIASVRDEQRAVSRETRLALHDMGIDAWNEVKNDEDESDMDDMFRIEAGFDVLPDLPKTKLFGGYKTLLIKLAKLQMFERYPCRTLTEQIDQTAQINENNVDTKQLVEETSAFLDKQAEDAGINSDRMMQSFNRRREMNAARRTERDDSLKTLVMDEFSSAFPEKFEVLWDALPVYAQWRIMVAIRKYVERAAGALKADAVAAVKNPWSTAAQDYDKVVVFAKDLKEEMDAFQVAHANDLRAAFEGRRLFENHII